MSENNTHLVDSLANFENEVNLKFVGVAEGSRRVQEQLEKSSRSSEEEINRVWKSLGEKRRMFDVVFNLFSKQAKQNDSNKSELQSTFRKYETMHEEIKENRQRIDQVDRSFGDFVNKTHADFVSTTRSEFQAGRKTAFKMAKILHKVLAFSRDASKQSSFFGGAMAANVRTLLKLLRRQFADLGQASSHGKTESKNLSDLIAALNLKFTSVTDSIKNSNYELRQNIITFFGEIFKDNRINQLEKMMQFSDELSTNAPKEIALPAQNAVSPTPKQTEADVGSAVKQAAKPVENTEKEPAGDKENLPNSSMKAGTNPSIGEVKNPGP